MVGQESVGADEIPLGKYTEYKNPLGSFDEKLA